MISIKRNSLLYHFLQYGLCSDRSKYGLENTFPTNICSLILRIILGVFMICCLIVCGSELAWALIHPFVIVSIILINNLPFYCLFASKWDLIMSIISLIVWCIIIYINTPPYIFERIMKRYFYFVIKIKRCICIGVAYEN